MKNNLQVIEEFKKLYGIQDTNTVLRLFNIKSKLASEKNVTMSDDELLRFLDNAMNYDEMQIWLIEKDIKGIEVTLDDTLKKFFELKTDEEILTLYDIEQNYNEKNIENVKKLIKNDNQKR